MFVRDKRRGQEDGSKQKNHPLGPVSARLYASLCP